VIISRGGTTRGKHAQLQAEFKQDQPPGGFLNGGPHKHATVPYTQIENSFAQPQNIPGCSSGHWVHIQAPKPHEHCSTP